MFNVPYLQETAKKTGGAGASEDMYTHPYARRIAADLVSHPAPSLIIFFFGGGEGGGAVCVCASPIDKKEKSPSK